jgi:hypothetical protein
MSSVPKTNKNTQQLPTNTQSNIEKIPEDNTGASNLSKNITTTENAPQNKELVPPSPTSNLATVR